MRSLRILSSGTATLLLCLLAIWPVFGAATPKPLYVQNFDSLPAGQLSAATEWATKDGTTLADAPGHGKALLLPFPYGLANLALPQMSATDTLTFRFSMMFPATNKTGADTSEKLLVFINDAAGKSLTLFFHDNTGVWGLKSGSGYPMTKDPSTSSWKTVEVTVDQAKKTVDAKLIDGNSSTVLLDNAPYADEGAGAPAVVSFARNGQGDPSGVYVDDISVFKTPAMSADRLNVWVDGAPRVNIVSAGKPVTLRIQAIRSAKAAADTLDWRVCDFQGASVRSGALKVPQAPNWNSSVALGTLPAGYYAFSATMRALGLSVSEEGSEPPNMASFGVLPAIRPLVLKHADDSRFGMQGTNFIQSGTWMKGNPYSPLFQMLGAKWVNDPASWYQLEPNFSGQYKPADNSPHGELSYAAQGRFSYLTTVHGFPAWAMAIPTSVKTASASTEQIDNQAYPPKDLLEYSDFLMRVGQHQAALRQTAFPDMAHNWYQVMWEPDWHWKGTDEQFVAMFTAAYKGIHAGDPSAEVLGPGYGVLDRSIERLKTLLPMGLGRSLDGIATHAYYINEGNPNAPPPPGTLDAPEDMRMIPDMRQLMALKNQYLRPGARVIQSEWGLDYKGAYTIASPQLLRELAAYLVRGHIILLGEGVDTTYFFYTADYQGESGFGLTFNLTMPTPNFGATEVAPKPAFMALAAMTRILEGTKTIGPVSGLPADIYAYKFQRGPQTVVAFWKAHGTSAPIILHIAHSNATLVDFMGNERPIPTATKSLKLIADAYPQYVIY